MDADDTHQATEAECASLGDHVAHLALAGSQISERPLLRGNCIEPLVDGEAAYPAMLEAIDAAQHSVLLATYIFDTSSEGRAFVAALARARERGVIVRVLVDDVGARYSRPQVTALLRQARVRTARFLSAWLPHYTPFYNLRNHRKLLIVDHTVAFTGGMNIRGAHAGHASIRDTHFRVEGPVVSQLREVFVQDWAFVTREWLDVAALGPPPAPVKRLGTVLARSIPDGPDDERDPVMWTMLNAIACARESVRVVTPYFLPDPPLAIALNVAAMRGVQVDIVLPERNNLRVVEWAMWGQLWQVLDRGCRIWLTPPPFDHAKLMTVDDRWVLLGSANWDPRSLRLNFELCVEGYGVSLAAAVSKLIDDRLRVARCLTLDAYRNRPLWIRLRDGVARLLQPYL